jgi:type II secretory ATPase GspE/PulE/Tfp pilus assembly ATPase PilB-like protein
MKNDVRHILQTWGWDNPPPYVVEQAERVLSCSGQTLLHVIESYGLGKVAELEELDRLRPRNVPVLDYLAQRVKGLANARQQILATFNGVLFYEPGIEESLLFAGMGNKEIAEHCRIHRCVAFHHPGNVNRMLIAFCEWDDLDKFEKAGRAERMENPLMGALRMVDDRPMVVLTSTINLNAALQQAQAGGIEGSYAQTNRSYWAHNQADTDAQRVVAKIFNESIELKSTDITLWPETDGTCNVLLRRHGDLMPSPSYPKIGFEHASEGIRFLMGKSKALSDGSTLAYPVDGKLQYRSPNRDVFMRHNYAPVNRNGLDHEMIVASMRIFTMENVEINLESLKLRPDLIEEIRQVLISNKGLILIVAPVNQGKSTTMGGIIAMHVKMYGVHGAKRMSVEMPVERNQEGLLSMSVEDEALLPVYIRALFRQDLDFAFIGEVRDSFTAAAFARVGTSGHICGSTGHAEDAVSGITMVINYLRVQGKSEKESLTVQPADFVSKLALVIAQRLVPELCQKCHIPHTLTENDLRDVQLHEKREMHSRSRVDELRAASVAGRLFRKNEKGCPHCFRGITGERPVNEWIPVSKALRYELSDMVQDNRFDYARVTQSRVGSLYDSAIDLVLEGKVALEDAIGL